MKPKFTLGGRLAIYLFLFLLVIVSFLLLTFTYILSCPILFTDPAPLTKQTLLDEYPRTHQDGKLTFDLSNEDFNCLVKGYLSAGNLPEYNRFTTVSNAVFIFGEGGSEKLYINLADKSAKQFSFTADSALSVRDGKIHVGLSNLRMGSYQLPVLGDVFWRLLNMPQGAFVLDMDAAAPLYVLESITKGENGHVLLTYVYDDTKLQDAVNTVLQGSDDKKISFHEAKGDIHPDLIRLARQKTATAAEAEQLVRLFEENSKNFEQLSYLLTPNGVRALDNIFGSSYYKYISVESLIKKSDDELNSDLNEYHKKFSKAVLQYLYENKDYTIQGDALYQGNRKITAQTILEAAKMDSDLYQIELKADNHCIYATYTLGDFLQNKAILGTLGGDENDLP